MAVYAYERLSAMDSTFLAFEDSHAHMHIGGPCIFDAGPLGTTTGSVDVERIRRYVETRLPLIPRYRQRLAFAPVSGQAVWVDDNHFNIFYHVRHTRVPHPGSERELKQLTAWILSQQLDRAKPLWEIWIIEGLEGGRFALVHKTHHCMVDGVGGVELLSALMKGEPDETIDETEPWIPRPAPLPADLLRDEARRGVRMPFAIARRAMDALSTPGATLRSLQSTVQTITKTLETGLQGAPKTPLNQPIGSHRRFDWLVLPLDDVKAVKNRLGGTVNDVVLAIAAGAVGHFLRGRGVSMHGLDFRVTVPVNVRASGDHSAGNHVSAWLATLPIQERDPTRRFAKVRQTTDDLKQSQQSLATESLMKLADWTAPALVKLGVKLTTLLNPYNMIVSNVCGPPFPLYLLGARMQEGYPQVPLFPNQGLGIALFSYNGKLCWGFNSDWDLFPDLDGFVGCVEASFKELQHAARQSAEARPAPRRARRTAQRRAG